MTPEQVRWFRDRLQTLLGSNQWEGITACVDAVCQLFPEAFTIWEEELRKSGREWPEPEKIYYTRETVDQQTRFRLRLAADRLGMDDEKITKMTCSAIKEVVLALRGYEMSPAITKPTKPSTIKEECATERIKEKIDGI